MIYTYLWRGVYHASQVEVRRQLVQVSISFYYESPRARTRLAKFGDNQTICTVLLTHEAHFKKIFYLILCAMV